MNVLEAQYAKIELVKRAVGNPALEWRNTYEVFINFPGASVTVYKQTLTDLCNAEKALHHNSVEYVRAIISTYGIEGRTTYDPESFIVMEIGAGTIIGSRVFSGDVMAAETVLSVKKNVVSGHSGRIFYRGCLAEGDIQSGTSLRAALAPASKTSLDTALSTFLSTFNAEMETLGGVNSQMVLLYGMSIDDDSPMNMRAVLSLEARGPSIRQINNAYFDVGG